MEGREHGSPDPSHGGTEPRARISRRSLLVATGSAIAVPIAWSAFNSNTAEGMTRSRVGVSIAGGEFSSDRPTFSNEHPGVAGQDYTYNSEKTFAYFADRGFRLQRLPFRWERLQPKPGGSLSPGAPANQSYLVGESHGDSCAAISHASRTCRAAGRL